MTPTASRCVRHRQTQLLREGLLPALSRWLPRAPIEAWEAQASLRHRLFTPLVTIWAMVGGVLAGQVSQAAMVRRVSAWLGRSIAPRSGSYAKACARVPVSLLAQLVRAVAEGLPRGRRGRRALLLDVTCLTLADTPANRDRYPQAGNQLPGCGFPLLKVAVLVDARSGAVLAWVTADRLAHDSALAQLLRDQVPAGSLVIADRAFGSHAFFAAMAARGVDVLVRQHQARVNQQPVAVGEWPERWTPSRAQARAGMPPVEVRVVAHALPSGRLLLLNTTLSRRRCVAAEAEGVVPTALADRDAVCPAQRSAGL